MMTSYQIDSSSVMDEDKDRCHENLRDGSNIKNQGVLEAGGINCESMMIAAWGDLSHLSH